MNTFTVNCKSFAKSFKAFLFIFFLCAGFLASTTSAQLLATDRLGYSPGDTAFITGSGFWAGETVTMQVVNADGSPNSNDAPWNVTADANGDFATLWVVPVDSSAFGELLLGTADGQSSALHAEVTFVDAGYETIDFQQAANQNHPAQPVSWINGILNPNNSDYFEGHGVPQRILFTGIETTPGDTHALEFRHQALKGGVHAYDFLMGWDQAILASGAIAQGPTNELQNLVAQACLGAISSDGLDACTSATNVLAIEVPDIMGNPPGVNCAFPPFLPTDPVITCFESIFGNRFVHVYGNLPVTWGELIFTGYAGSGDVYATYMLRWKSASDKVKILLAGRSSQSCVNNCCGYGNGCGAGSVSGGPYHFKLDELDGVTTGSQDNQLQATPPPANPVCDSVVISGPDTVCPNTSGHVYTSTYTGLCDSITHHWSVTGAGVIEGPTNTASITVTAGNFCGSQFSICDTITCAQGEVVCCRIINIDDNIAPSVTCPNPVSSVECPDTPDANFGSATATDNCDTDVGITADDITTPGSCPQEYSVTRTWTATDNCQNTSSCSRTITVTDNTAPVITCPAVSNVECPGAPNFGSATATDACDTLVVPVSVDVTTPGSCPQEFSVTRTWTATDDCGNFSTCSRTIAVTDNTPPAITCPNPAASVECPGTPIFGPATATDACDNNVVPTSGDVSTPGSCPQEFSVTRTWTAIDDCGNSSTCSRTISVTDNTAPAITCPNPAASVECPGTPNFGSATATDVCDNNVVPTASNVTTPGSCPQEFTVTRTWTAIDDCGNSSTCSRTISVTDNTPPAITCPNPAASVECPGTPTFGSAAATDACDNNVVPTSSDVTTPGSCPQEFSATRTWTATDDCGNSSTCSRTISVTDNTPPAITCPNPAATVECPGTPNFGSATATDACDNNVVPTSSDATTPGSCPQEFSVTRTWTATDDCGNSSTCSRTISVTDNTPPAITCPNLAATVECPGTPNFGSAAATDACDNSVSPIFSDVTTTGICVQEFTVTRTWTATDDCGNSSTCSRTISVEDNTPPAITCPNPAATVECPGTPNFGSAAATDACDNNVVPTSSDVTTPGSCQQEFSVTRTWTATDDCGNSSTCSRTISVTDNTPPVITCPSVSSPIECPATPSFGSATASDACDNSVTPSFSDITTPGSCVGEYTVTRTWTATDDCGNSSGCSAVITVEDNTAPALTCPPDETVPGENAGNSNAPCIDLGGGGVATVTNPNPNGPHSHVGIDFRQPRNEKHPATPLYWTHGVNNHTQAEYHEGMGVPQRLIFTGLTGTTHTLRFRHQAVKRQSDDRHAYDFLMSWNQAVATAGAIGNDAVNELQNLNSQMCNGGISATAAAACSLFSTIFPPDTRHALANVPDNMGNPPNHHGNANVNDVIACFEGIYGNRNIELIGNAPVSNFAIAFDGYSGNSNGDNYAWYTVTWTSTSSQVLLKFAGRAASGSDTCGYGACFGAGSINGAPYHFKLDLLDGYSTGNRDNQLMVDVENCEVNIPVTFGTPDVSDQCDPNPDVVIITGDSVTNNSDGSITHCRTWEATDDCGNTSECSQCITVTCDSAFINGPQVVENPYEMHCTQTQNFWGSSNNGQLICSGENSDQAKLWLLTAFGNINIGCPGNSLTLTMADVACINTRLPANGGDARIYGNNTCNSVVGIQLQSNGRFRNKLLGQTMALAINLRLDASLGELHLDGQYMTVQEASGCDVDAVANGNIRVYTIPASVITYLGANNSVNDLLALANAALCGSYLQSVGAPTLKEISKAVEAINNGFDGCTFLLGFSNTLRDGELANNGLTLDNPINAAAFPNPFNSNTTIRFAMDNSYDNVKLEIFNAIGEVIAVPFYGAADEGVTYTVEFDGSAQPAGIYFYRISAGSETFLDKLMLIK